MFETYLAPAGWQDGLEPDAAQELTATLAQLRITAQQVLGAALDASLAHLGRERLGALLDAAGAEGD